MLKKGITNYFKSLKHFFTPLGTMFLGIMIGFSVLFSGVVDSAATLIDGIKQLAQNVNLDFSVLLDYVWSAVKSLDWSEPVTAIKTATATEWINDTLTQSLNVILGTDFETFKMQIVDIVDTFCRSVGAYIAVFFLFWILGFMAGFALITLLIRRDIAKRSLWKFILAYLLNSVMSTATVIAGLVVYSLWKVSIIVTLFVASLLCGVIALIQAYLLYGYKRMPFKDVVNFKNACLHALTNQIIFVISICFTLIAMAVNKLMGLFVGLSFVTIAIIVINLNAESFVLEQVKSLPALPVVNNAEMPDEIK